MMAPVFQVLRCYQCQVFQVHQVKKKIKWECKLCGEKQSFKHRYGIGTAKECRIHVQKLNLINGEAKEAIESKGFDEPNTEDEEEDISPPQPKRPLKSKWKSYIDDAEEQVEKEVVTNENEGGIEVVLEIPKKKKSKWQPPTAFARVDNTSESTENYTAENCFYENIDTDITHWHNQIKEAKKDVKPHSHAKAIETITSKVSEQVNVKTVPSINSNSKWAQYVKADEDDDSQSLSLHDTTDTHLKKTDTHPEKTDTTIKTVPSINKNSKWAHFVKEEDNKDSQSLSLHDTSDIHLEKTDTHLEKTDTNPDKTNSTMIKGQNLNIFSLNDDINLDDFLDF